LCGFLKESLLEPISNLAVKYRAAAKAKGFNDLVEIEVLIHFLVDALDRLINCLLRKPVAWFDAHEMISVFTIVRVSLKKLHELDLADEVAVVFLAPLEAFFEKF
jgi:hypothetical protein